MNNKTSCKSAFTLIELLVVVLIIGILASIALPQYQVAVMKSRYATLKNITKSLALAEEVYYLANGVYTDNFEELTIEPSGCELSTDKKSCIYTWGACSLRYNNGITQEDSVQCFLNNRIQYMIYFNHSRALPGERICVARNRDLSSAENKVCKSDTGAATPGTNSAGSYTWLYLN